jgi:hypothetical protein
VAVLDGDAGAVRVGAGDPGTRAILQIDARTVGEGEASAARARAAHVAAVTHQPAAHLIGDAWRAVPLPGQADDPSQRDQACSGQQPALPAAAAAAPALA